MTFSRANALGWAPLDELTAAQANTIDINQSRAVDGYAGGTYSPSAIITFNQEIVFTAAGAAGANATAITATGKGNEAGIVTTGGATSGDGITATGGAPNGAAGRFTGTGNGTGITATGGGTNGIGVFGTGGATNGIGIRGVGTGTAAGMSAQGGGTSGTGIAATGGAPNGHGGDFTGDGTGEGLEATGGDSDAAGLLATGGATNGDGVHAQGTGTGVGTFTRGGGGAGAIPGPAAKAGIVALGGDTASYGGYFGSTGTAAAVKAVGDAAANSRGVDAQGQGTAEGVYGVGGGTDGTGGKFVGGVTDGIGVEANGTAAGEGIKVTSGATAPHMHLVPRTADPGAFSNGDVWLNDTAGDRMVVARLNGVNFPLVETWAEISTDGAGGATLNDGHNVSGVAINGQNVDITFNRNFANATYVVVGQSRNTATNVLVTANKAVGVTQVAMFDDLGAQVNLSNTARGFDVLVVGKTS